MLKQKYRDHVGYEKHMIGKYTTHEQAESVREAICELVLRGKLNALDLKIIEARDCSPMPSLRKIARQMNLSHTTIENRVARIKRLVSSNIPQFILL